ncbi:unnamed protein product [Pieris brassicae]|uniref:Uncharacterized protein n=1 Tax=Pieris brassicae TaxID=7116 RepID=A0A9P0T4C6_PIEBR|nr:unnamed protein product [Pieris brassicae]
MNRSIIQIRGFIRTYKKRFYSNKPDSLNENTPIKFTTSAASKSRIMPIINKRYLEMPWYQPYSVVGSVAVFLLYFCVFREESDIDSEFEKTLYDRVHGLEKQQLLLSYRFNKENGKSVVEIEQRLKEIEEKEKSLAIA